MLRLASNLLEKAIQGAQRVTALTQRMLAFARLQYLSREPVKVPDFTTRAWAMPCELSKFYLSQAAS
jgi:hypothetical protein